MKQNQKLGINNANNTPTLIKSKNETSTERHKKIKAQDNAENYAIIAAATVSHFESSRLNKPFYPKQVTGIKN